MRYFLQTDNKILAVAFTRVRCYSIVVSTKTGLKRVEKCRSVKDKEILLNIINIEKLSIHIIRFVYVLFLIFKMRSY